MDSRTLGDSSPIYRLERQQSVGRPRDEVFDFFSDPANLERITPSSLRFQILSDKAPVMRAGTVIDYRLQVAGVGFRWRTLITVWEPNLRFVDVQERGPYQLWRHTHEFEDAPGGGTLVRDRVEYQLPLGRLGRIAHRLFVERQLRAIFAFRRQAIERLLP
jgi:ligand-binding SRPBCC domain-containing protein